MITFSKRYIQLKQDEYFRLAAESANVLSGKYFNNYVATAIVDILYEYIAQLDTNELNLLAIIPKSYLKLHRFRNLSMRVRSVLTNRFNSMIKELWTKSFELGRKHALYDALYPISPFKKFLDQSENLKNVSSFFYNSLSEAVGIAEFEESEEDRKKKQDIARARRNLTILQNNLKTLKAEGLYKNADQDDGKISRMTITQRLAFLRATEEISNFDRKAEVMQRDFLGNYYMNQRYRVLSQDYADSYDKYIQDKLGDYLNKNIEGIKQIKNQTEEATALRHKIAEKLMDSDVIPDIEANNKAVKIIRTELGLAYNFGKLAGFASPEDRNKKMVWRADFELQGRVDDYEVCQYCKDMHGRIYTVDQILRVGAVTDRGILSYNGNNRTSFKNPEFPTIVAHPNCSCMWIPISDEDADREEFERTLKDTIPKVASTALILSGAFLLARSNVWRSFLQTSNIAKTTTQSYNVVNDFIRTGEAVNNTGNKDLYELFRSAVSSLVD